MQTIVILIKTYRPDFFRLRNLLASIEKHNVDSIPVYISVNNEDYDFFCDNLDFHNHTLLKDKEIVESSFDNSWCYQQIIKMQFYKLNVCKNYLCIDSDSEFIKDFHISDFMYDEVTPYTVMHEAKNFLDVMEIIGVDSDSVFMKQSSRSVRKLFNIKRGKNWDYGPSPYIWSTYVWEHFFTVYLKATGQTIEELFEDFIRYSSPSECAIYGEYLLQNRLIDLFPIEGLFKVYHYKKQYEFEKKYYNVDRLKKNYFGIIFQSNWENKSKFKFW